MSSNNYDYEDNNKKNKDELKKKWLQDHKKSNSSPNFSRKPPHKPPKK